MNSHDFFLGLFEHLHVLCLKNIQRQQQKAPQRSESKGPKTCFLGFKTKPKLWKNRGPGALQQQSGSEQGPEVKNYPKLKNTPSPQFWTHFECFLGMIFRIFLEPPFFVFWQNRSPEWNQNGVHFWGVGPSSSVVNNNKISLAGALDGVPFLGSLRNP